MTVRFVIDPAGRVDSAEVLESNVKNADADRCVLDVIKTLKFPAPRGDGYVIVTYPFIVDITGG